MRVNFTPRTQEILAVAKKIAVKQFHKEVSPEHLLLSFVKVDSFIVPYLKEMFNVDFDELESVIQKSLDKLPKLQKQNLKIKFSEDFKKCLEYAHDLSAEKQHSYVSVEHLLYSMINNLNSSLVDYFFESHIDVFQIQDFLEEILSSDVSKVVMNADEMNSLFTTPDTNSPFANPAQFKNQSALESYSVNLNELAKEGNFNFIFPNPSYISQIEETLCKKTKSCALIVGNAGVGKTALVEGLSKKIVDLTTNDYLINKKILSVDISAMVAGTKYRGQFEERLKNFIDEAKDEENIILFIDEIHTIVGAGNSEGALDAANILKPYIARGELTCIGSTTHEEYKKSFAKDPALKRRFDVIKVKEPTPKEAEDILVKLFPDYATYHGVGYSISSIQEAINLSCRFMVDKQLPDKAIDLLDQAGSALKIKHYKKPKKTKFIEKLLIDDTVDAKTKNEFYDKYKKMVTKWRDNKAKQLPVVEPLHIRQIISKNFDIPIESLNETFSDKLLNLEKRMSKDVIGQNQAIEKIVNSLFKSHCGLQDPSRPIGSFLFLGKTGVGKTLTSKSLASNYFGSQSKLIYFDMSEFSESNSVSKFSGSSPGYVGYEKGGILTEKIKQNPHCVVLFDEVEKAHPIVLQSLLQILEEGRLTDNTGEETSFKNCIIILTSNLGADLIDKHGSLGFLKDSHSNHSKIIDEAKKSLSPELINRFDGIVVFNNFDSNHLLKITNIELNKVKHKLKNREISIHFKPKVKHYIVNKSIEENLGGRPIRRIIQNEIETCLSKFIIHNQASNIIVDIKDDQYFCYEKTSKASQPSS